MHVLIVSGLAGYSQSDLCDLGRSSLASEGEGRVADALLSEIKSFPPSLAQANDPPLMDPGGSQRWSSCLGCECVRLRLVLQRICSPPPTVVPGACSAQGRSFAITAGNDPSEAEIKS